jgi:TRAP-type mannitol/chloroaromatic compound transport system permease small subunit
LTSAGDLRHRRYAATRSSVFEAALARLDEEVGPILPQVQQVIAGIDAISDWIGRAVSWLTLVMVLATAYDVIMRYLFNITYVFIQEAEWYLFSLIFLLAAGYGLRHDSHVRVDIFYARLTARGRAWIDVGGAVLFLFPTCYLIVTASIPYVSNSWSDLEVSPDPGGIPFRYLLKSAIPVGFVLLGFQGIAHLLKNLVVALGFAEPQGSGTHVR